MSGNTVSAPNGNARIRAVWTTSLTATHLNISVYFDLELINGGSSSGTYGVSWWGYWNGSENRYHNIGTNGAMRIVTGSYSIPRTTWDQETYFAASAQSYQGNPGHHFNLTIPKLVTAPPAPSNVSGTPDQATRTSLRYQFSGNGDGGSAITRWEAQYSKNSNFSGVAPIVTSSGTSVITGLDPRTRYYFRSRGVNAIGNGSWSSAVSRDTLDYADAPIVVVDSKSSSSATLKIFDPAYTGGSITDREVQLSRFANFSSIVGSGTLSLSTINGLTRATTYYARARVANAFGYSSYSQVLEFSTLATLPSAPSGYAVSDIASTTAYVTLPTVTDNGGTPLSDLRVQVNTSASATGATTVTVGSFRSAFLGDLVSGQLYYARLAVQNSGEGGGWSDYGPWVSFTTKTNVPTPPLNLDVTVTSNTTANVEWDPPLDLLGSTLLGYQLRLASNPAFSEGLRTLTFPIGTDLVALDGLLEGTRYYVQARAQSSNGAGSYTSVGTFQMTGIAPDPQAQWLRIGASWKPGLLWLRVAGAWRQGVLWERVGGVWRGPGGTP